jgi:hypothetical protein
MPFLNKTDVCKQQNLNEVDPIIEAKILQRNRTLYFASALKQSPFARMFRHEILQEAVELC